MSVGRYHCPNCDQIVTRPHLCPALTQPQPKEPTGADPQAAIPERPTESTADDRRRQEIIDEYGAECNPKRFGE